MFRLTARTRVRQPIDQVFDFFADAMNLERLTPPWLQFAILTPPPIPMGAGTLIDYRLRLHGVPFRWRSEITHWNPPFHFVDEQRRGPYRSWTHLHRFHEEDGGVVIDDVVHYAVPGGPPVHRWFVRRRLEEIFAFRHQQMHDVFRSGAGMPPASIAIERV